MQDFTQLIAQYGIALVFANVLLQQIGLPIPAVPTLVLAGALAADGRLSAGAVLGAAALACLIGDSVWYLAGRAYGNPVMRLLCRVSLSPDSCVRQSETQFERWGRLALVLGKFVPGLSTIAPPLAGVMGMRWPAFLVLSSLGILLWAGLAIGAGMVFHAQVDYVLGRLEDLGSAAAALGAALLAGYIAFKWWQRLRFFKALRLARITVGELSGLRLARRGTVVIDVRSRVARGSDPRFIPGALALDLEDLDQRLYELPMGEEIVFYCSCPNEASAAVVARRLIDRGYTRVRPLLGGLEAWVEAGYEVESRAIASTIASAGPPSRRPAP